MRIAGNVVGIILVLIGALWIAQGSNLMPNTMMSGQSLWLWIGVVAAIVGLGLLWWVNRRR
jgi:LPXTG-motif cell wall-anchored protein